MSILAISIQHITESLSLSNWETEVSKCQWNFKWKIKKAYIWRTYDLIIVILDKEDEGRNVIIWLKNSVRSSGKQNSMVLI